MTRGFPTYTPAARKGEAGVSLVAKIVTDQLGWLFRRHHQEQDFGVDGQIEIVTDEGAVTGQSLAAQIKYGRSFFTEKNQWGYVYRGETKHFNYLANYPTVVLIVICHPVSKDCYWVPFEPEATEVTERGWKLTIPFENRLHTRKAELLSLVGEPIDQLAALQAYWQLNKMLVETSVALYVLDDLDVKAMDTSHARAFFDRLRKTKPLAAATQGKIEFSFSGYDTDPRELFEIPDVRRYIEALDLALPELFFFIRTEEPAYALKLIVFCRCNAEWEGQRSTLAKVEKVGFDTKLLAQFMEDHWPALNELTDWLGMPEEENKRICYSVMRHLGFNPADFDADA